MADRWMNYTCPNSDCDGPSVPAVYEPGEHGWGSDADGNRGIDVPGFWYAIAPSVCPTCKRKYTAAEQSAIQDELDRDCREPYDGDNDDFGPEDRYAPDE